jgi:chaperonin cofactor prefoldin
MATTVVQIRNVPAEFRLRLKNRAALEGISMSEFVLREVGKVLERPSRQDVLDQLRSQPLRQLSRSAAEVLRDERSER